MARYLLLLQPDGRCVITSTEPIDVEELTAITALYQRWRDAEPPIAAVIPDVEVVRVTSIELHLEAVAAAGASS